MDAKRLEEFVVLIGTSLFIVGGFFYVRKGANARAVGTKKSAEKYGSTKVLRGVQLRKELAAKQAK